MALFQDQFGGDDEEMLFDADLSGTTEFALELEDDGEMFVFDLEDDEE